jgi:hypothetical protein
VRLPGRRPRLGRSRTFRLALAVTFGILRARVRAVFYKSDKITASWSKARRRDRVLARVPFDVCQSARDATSTANSQS